MDCTKITLASDANGNFIAFLNDSTQPLASHKGLGDFSKAVVTGIYENWEKSVGADSSVYVPSKADLGKLELLKKILVGNYEQGAGKYSALWAEHFTTTSNQIADDLVKTINKRMKKHQERVSSLKQNDLDWQERVNSGVGFCIPYDLVKKYNPPKEPDEINSHELSICLGGARRGFKGIYVEENESTNIELVKLEPRQSTELPISFQQLVDMIIANKIMVSFAVNHLMANPQYESLSDVQAVYQPYITTASG